MKPTFLSNPKFWSTVGAIASATALALSGRNTNAVSEVGKRSSNWDRRQSMQIEQLQQAVAWHFGRDGFALPQWIASETNNVEGVQ